MRKMLVVLACLFTFSVQAKVVIPKPYLSPQVEQKQQSIKTNPLTRPGICELEIANLSHKGAYVDLFYDNYTVTTANYVAPGYSLYVPLHYAGYCHSSVFTFIYSPESIILYKDFGYVDQILKIYSGLNSSIGVKMDKK